MKIIPAIFEEIEIRRLYDEKTETWLAELSSCQIAETTDATGLTEKRALP